MYQHWILSRTFIAEPLGKLNRARGKMNTQKIGSRKYELIKFKLCSADKELFNLNKKKKKLTLFHFIYLTHL